MSMTGSFAAAAASQTAVRRETYSRQKFALNHLAHVIAALLGIYVIVFTYLSLCQQTHSRRLQDLESSIIIGLLDAQSGHRAYLITGDPAFLAQYRAGLKTLATFKPVYQRALVDSRSKRLYRDMDSLLSLDADEMNFTISLHDKAGTMAAIAALNDRRNDAHTGQIQSLLLEIRKIESEHVAPFQIWSAARQR
jgi:CHASE3 domain sensor protein